MADRMGLGDDLVHVGGPEFVANAGAVEYGGPRQLGIGTLSDGGASWGSTGSYGQPYTSAGDPYPASPSVDRLQVYPLSYQPEYSAAFPENNPDRWKGAIGERPHAKTGKSPDDSDDYEG